MSTDDRRDEVAAHERVGELRFESRLRALRHAGCVYFRLEATGGGPSPSKSAALDAVARAAGLGSVGSDAPGWHELTREQAGAVLIKVLSRDLAYGVELMSELAARELAEGFLAFFPPHARYFSNGWAEGSFMPLSEATFDTGVIALHPELSGILWFADED